MEKGVKGIDEGLGKLNKTLDKWDKAWKDKLNPQSTGERGRKWFDHHILGKDEWNDSSSAPGLPPPLIRKRDGAANDPNDPTSGVPKLLDLGPIVGSDPTSWNPTPISNTYANRSNSVSNTTNNYGAGGAGGSVTINIVSPPGFSATTNLSGLNAGLA